MSKMRHGFTLIELSLSMAFIGVLSVAVVLIISNTVSAYRRGMILGQVNTTGMDIVDDMRWAVGNSSSRSATSDCERQYKNNSSALKNCVDDGAYSFVAMTKYAKVVIDERGDGSFMNDDEQTLPIYGAFCTGTYSYIWNSGYFDMDGVQINGKKRGENGFNSWAKLKYEKETNQFVTIQGSLRKRDDVGDSNIIGDSDRPFRLLKVRDDYRSVCVSVAKTEGGDYIGSSELRDELQNGEILKDNTFNITNYRSLGNEEPVDLILADSDNELALFDLYAAKPAESTTQKNMFYSVSFILGTVSGGTNINRTNGKACAAPTNYLVENYEYCAINKFNFATQASGEL